ncbi:MAG: beta-ketoacyl reductase [Opitutales bacterium]|nr:beta-ketoacyl reductase [Opitutales bacterium]
MRLVEATETHPSQVSPKPITHALITGGLGGIGRTVAKQLLKEGVHRITLVGRSSRSDSGFDDLEHPSIHYKSLDIGDPSAVATLKVEIPAVSHIFHTAGSWKDCPIESLDVQKLDEVLAPKVAGTLNLIKTFDAPNLERIQLFSAFSSIMPAHGQANYAAANAFLDAAAHLETEATIQTINWGPWSDVGFAATAIGARAHTQLENFGIRRFNPTRGYALLESAMLFSEPALALIDVDWAHLFEADPQAALMPMLAVRVAAVAVETPVSNASEDVIETLRSIESVDQRMHWLLTKLTKIIADILQTTSDELPGDTSLLLLGVDSLIAVQVKNSVERTLGISLPMARILEGPTLHALTEEALTHLSVIMLQSNAATGSDIEMEEIEI